MSTPSLQDRVHEVLVKKTASSGHYGQRGLGRTGGRDDVEKWLDANNWPHDPAAPLDGENHIIRLGRCPSEDQHGTAGGDAGAFVVFKNGGLLIMCYHAGCEPETNTTTGRPDRAGQTKKAIEIISAVNNVKLKLPANSGSSTPNYAVVTTQLVADCYKANNELALRNYRGAFYRWHDNGYEAVPDQEVRNEVMTWLMAHSPQQATMKTLQTVMCQLAAICHVALSVEFGSWLDGTQGGPDWFAFQNGVLDVQAAVAGKATSECLHPPSPAFFGPPAVPYSFDSSAKCPRFEKILEEVLPAADLRETVQQFNGYTLVRDAGLETSLMFLGNGANGKGFAGETTSLMLGKDNVCSVPLSGFGDRFSGWRLAECRLNYVSELPVADGSSPARIAEERFKAVVSGEMMQFERKFKDCYHARPTVKLLFACNELPPFYDRSNGVWRRLIIIPFNFEVPEERRVEHLAQKVFHEEAAGIFNWALAGLRTLRSIGRFVEPEQSRQLKLEHRLAMDHEQEFLLEHYELATERDAVAFDEMKRKHKGWCDDNGYRECGANKLAQAVQRVFTKVKRVREWQPSGFGQKARRVTLYRGIRELELPKSVA